MFQKAQRKLMIMYMTVTSAILLIALVLFVFLQVYQWKSFEERIFENAVANTIELLTKDSEASDELDEFIRRWDLSAEVIRQEQVVFSYKQPQTDISISELNGMLAFHESHVLTLDADGNEIVPTEEHSVLNHFTYELDFGSSGSFYGTTVTYLDAKGTLCRAHLFTEINILGYISAKFVIFCIFILIGGSALLYVTGRFFVRKALEPVQVNMKQQKDFIAAASHELKSPLAVIQSCSEAAVSFPDEADRYHASIQKECCRMGQLVESMLSLSALETNKEALHMEIIDTEQFFVEFYEQMEPFCNSRCHTLSAKLPDEILPAIQGDKAYLTQLFCILIDNAVSYSPEGSEVAIEVRPAGQELCIDIKDRGEGIPDSEKETIFDRFYRTDGSRHDKSHTGLGLSIAKEIVCAHNGSIEVLNREGGGSIFRVRFNTV